MLLRCAIMEVLSDLAPRPYETTDSTNGVVHLVTCLLHIGHVGQRVSEHFSSEHFIPKTILPDIHLIPMDATSSLKFPQPGQYPQLFREIKYNLNDSTNQ